MYTYVLIPLLASFLIAVFIGKPIIKFLQNLRVSNTEREELESHQVKSGTPSMGGLIFLIAMAIPSVIFGLHYQQVWPVLFLTFGFGIIGFLDDYLKTVKRHHDGLIHWQKFLLQIVVTTVFIFWLYFIGYDLSLKIPFMETSVNIGIWAIPVAYLAILGTVNGVNFTDGLDGLSSSVTIAVISFFGVASLLYCGGITPVIAAMIGALSGFLTYNVYPAKVFMGDTGSLAMGGFVIAIAYMMQMPLFVIIVGFVYLMEVVSVILQVGYFKITHGKRIFRMAPIHHHFELGGWSETKVVCIFTMITIFLGLVGYAAL